MFTIELTEEQAEKVAHEYFVRMFPKFNGLVHHLVKPVEAAPVPLTHGNGFDHYVKHAAKGAIFHTRELAQLHGINGHAASRRLVLMSRAKIVKMIKKDVWKRR